MEPQSATSFYIPFYGGLAVGKYLFSNSSNESRDFHALELIKWVQSQPYWLKSNGLDHFIVLGRITWDFRRLTDPEQKWGSTFLNMPEMQNVTRLMIEKDAPRDYLDLVNLYPNLDFYPRTIHIFKACGEILLVDCGVTLCANGSLEIMSSLLGSEFCLQPRGDSFTRRSVFDCMVAGSIPVLFWNRTMYDQYEWYLPKEPESYSVFIDHDDVSKGKKSIKGVLESYSREKVREMRERVIEIIPKIVYSEGEMNDAFEIAIDGVLRRFKDERYQRLEEAELNVARN
ncbi:xyloglucan galactosyltransferase XLT2-like protein [Tanacetum coccineum]